MQKDMNIFPLTHDILHGIRVTRAARPEKSPIKRHFMHVSAFERNIGKRYFVHLYCIVRYTGSPAVCPFRPRSCMQPAADDACAVYERRGARRAPSGTPAGGRRPPQSSGAGGGGGGGAAAARGGGGEDAAAPGGRRGGARPLLRGVALPPAGFRRLALSNRAPRPPLSGKKEPPHPGIHTQGTAAPCAEAGSAYSFE